MAGQGERPRERPAERWLLLDEPETALDANVLSRGLCTLLHAAEPGVLRVFCASHSLLFPAGLADHPKVQVLDFGRDQSWFAKSRAALALVRSPDDVDALGASVAARIRGGVAERKAAAERERLAVIAKAVKGLQAASRFLLTEALKADDGMLPEVGRNRRRVTDTTIRALEERQLVKVTSWRDPRAKLTPLGIEAARTLELPAEDPR
jgi:hypothetical protein